MAENWEHRVYERYVSLGNLAAKPDPNLLYGQNRPYVEKIIRDHFPTPKSLRILELACGPAPVLFLLKQRGYSNLVGIDTSPEQVALAHAVGLEKEVLQGDMLEFLNATELEEYDIIILFDILEHFDRIEQLDVLDKVFARLKPNGKCIMHVPNAEGCFGGRVLYSDITHKSAFTRRSMEQMLRTIGFEEIWCFEDKPISHGLFSIIRRTIWEVVTMGQVIALGAETGNIRRNNYILSQNMLAVAQKVATKA